jgi:hypothetical protein
MNGIPNPQQALIIGDLGVDVLPGGCTEPVIHWLAVAVVIELLRSTPAY